MARAQCDRFWIFGAPARALAGVSLATFALQGHNNAVRIHDNPTQPLTIIQIW